MIRGTQSAEVVVVGAGPYGLSAAAHLLEAGVETRIFGYPMSAWQDHMPKGMFLKSTFKASSLSALRPGSTLDDHCLQTGSGILDEQHPVPRDLFVEYGLRFQQRYVKDVERKAVHEVALTPGGFRVSADGETVRSKAVIVASGHVAFADIPRALRDIAKTDGASGKLVSHSSEHADFAEFSGSSVAVVGAGQSALESAALLHENGAKVHLLIRARSILWGGPPATAREHALHKLAKPGSPLGPGWSLFVLSGAPEMVAYLPAAVRLYLVRTVLGPSGAWWLRDRVAGRIDVSLDTVVDSARAANGKVSLDLRHGSGGTSKLQVDHVVAATGYKVDVDTIQFLDPELRAKVARVNGSTAPHLSSSFQSSIPGLYFVGLSAAATFGPLLRFVCGAQFASSSIRRMFANGR